MYQSLTLHCVSQVRLRDFLIYFSSATLRNVSCIRNKCSVTTSWFLDRHDDTRRMNYENCPKISFCVLLSPSSARTDNRGGQQLAETDQKQLSTDHMRKIERLTEISIFIATLSLTDVTTLSL